MSPHRDIRPPGEPGRHGVTDLTGDAHLPTAGVDRPDVREALERLLELAASLRELPLDGVEPAFGPPRWE